MKRERCKCGHQCFETIDITPGGCNETQYFVRCCKCGLVAFSNSYIAPPPPTFFEKITQACRLFMGNFHTAGER